MKKKFLLLMTLCLLAGTKALGTDATINGIHYDFMGDEAMVTFNNWNGVDYSGSVVIPNSVTYNGKTYSVTTINSYAFNHCSNLVSITIPSTLKRVKTEAFTGCTSLKKVIVKDIAAWCGIIYDGDDDGRGDFPLGLAQRPHLYRDENTEITNIVIPEGVTRIEPRAFRDAVYVTSITIPSSVTYIGKEAFRGMNILTSINIPEGITSIEQQTFDGCLVLPSISIPNSVTSIGKDAFYKCEKLTSITIPNSVTSIGEDAFWGTPWFNNQPDGLVYAGKVAYKYKGTMPEGTQIVLKEGTLGIANSAFADCSRLTSVTITNSVTNIGYRTFWRCYSLNSVIIPNSVTNIGDQAFSECKSLTSITIPNSVVTIDGQAFFMCMGLTSVTIPNSVTSIGSETFYDCRSLNSITIGSGLKSVGNRAFRGCNNLNYVTLLCDSIRTWFKGMTSIQRVVIGNSVTNIDSQAFQGCSGLSTVIFGNNLTSVGKDAFDGTAWYNNQPDGLVYTGKIAYKYKGTAPTGTEIEIEDGTVGITEQAFANCADLTSISIPGSVTRIGEKTFSGCTSLTSIIIPNGVTSIGNETFKDCSSLSSATIGSGVTTIGNQAFSGCSSLPAITIPNSVTSIDSQAFKGCSSLSSIVIPNSVTSIGDEAFKDCGSVTSLTLGNGLTTISDNAFENCSSLTSITIPDSVTGIGTYAFNGCGNVTSIIIGSGVETIGDFAFQKFWGLTDVYCYAENVPATGGNAFNQSSALATLHVPASAMDAYNAASPWNSFNSIEAIDDRTEQTLELAELPLLNTGGVTYTLPQQTDQGLTLTWSIADATIASISGYQLTPLSGGTTTVTATQAGNSQYLPFTKSYTLTVAEDLSDTDISQLENAIYIEPAEARAGATVTLSVKMKNSFIAEGFGFDLVLPDGITVALDEYGFPMAELSTERTNSRITNHFDVDFKPDGSLNVQAYSTRGLPIEGHDGEVALITINLSEDLTAGEYPIILKNIAITDENSVTVTIEQVTSVLEVPAYIIGDANNDGNVNVGDLTAISHYILERPDASFLFPAADANQDGNVNVGDLTAVSHIILWGSIVRPQQGAPVKAVLPKSSLLLDPQ